MNEDKFKKKEAQMRAKLPISPYYAIRMDGRAFHTFTKQFKAPYSEDFMEAMNNAGMVAATQVLAETKLCYVQSDEITLIAKTKDTNNVSFGGRMDKILSLTSSAATAGFMKALPETNGFPLFDSRIIALADKAEIIEYLDWRRLDARKNSITMAAQHVHGHHALKGKSTKERLAMLQGTEFEILPYEFYFGRIGHTVKVEKEVTVPHRGTFTVERSEWKISAAFQDVTQEIVERMT